MYVSNVVSRLHLQRQAINVAVFNNSCGRFEQYMYFCVSNYVSLIKYLH